jgi:diaminopimelate epimerase
VTPPMPAVYKVSGGGNDFLALVEPAREPSADEIRAWCARGLSLGADGLFTITRSRTGDSDVVMRYWNADGKTAALCINGTRCAARLALTLGWTSDRFRVATDAGTFGARAVQPTEIALELPAPDEWPRKRVLTVGDREITGWFVTVGVPHFVVVWPESLREAPVDELGSALRWHSDFAPAGTNVDFVRFPERHRMEIRSFERGVEAETLACGTGTLASAAVGLQLDLAELPVVAMTLGGFALTVAGETVDAALASWSLAGDARVLGAIELLPEAGIPPPTPPRWSD